MSGSSQGRLQGVCIVKSYTCYEDDRKDRKISQKVKMFYSFQFVGS